MPPKKYFQETKIRIKKAADRIRRLQETDEQRQQRISRFIQNKNLKNVSESRTKNRDLQFQIKMCQELYETIRSYKNQQGRRPSKSFIRLPNRRSLPVYNDIVTSPIDLRKIQKKLKSKEYIDVQQFTSDIELMVNSAKRYYEKGSVEYQNACELRKVFSDAKIRKEEEYKTMKINDKPVNLRNVTVGEQKNPAKKIKKDSKPGETQHGKQWMLFHAVENYGNSKGGKLSELFWKLPDPSCYPEYYKLVERPISLSTIREKIEKHEYLSPAKVVADMNLMFTYAKMYNTDDPRVFESAVILEKVMQNKTRELIYPHMEQLLIPRIKVPTKPKRKKIKKNKVLMGSTSDSNENLPYGCLWDNCNHQFKTFCDLANHLHVDSYGHIQQTYDNRFSEKFECLWYKCKRINKNLQPFPSVVRLVQHVRAVHLQSYSKNALTEYQKKCRLLTKIIGMEDQVPLIDSPQVAPIKEELILPDDEMNPSFNSSSEPVRVETDGTPGVDENTREPGSVPYDTWLMVDVTESTTAPPDEFAHTQTLQSSVGQLHTKFSNSIGNNTPVPHMKPLIAIQMRGLPNYRNQLLITEKATLDNILPHTPFTGQQPITAPQVPLNAQSQQSVTIDLPQAASSIKQELILSEDVTSLSLINSSSEPTRVEKTFCVNQDGSITKFKSEITIENQLKNVPLNGQLSSVATVVTTNSDITPMEVDLNLVKKEVDDETPCH